MQPNGHALDMGGQTRMCHIYLCDLYVAYFFYYLSTSHLQMWYYKANDDTLVGIPLDFVDFHFN